MSIHQTRFASILRDFEYLRQSVILDAPSQPVHPHAKKTDFSSTLPSSPFDLAEQLFGAGYLNQGLLVHMYLLYKSVNSLAESILDLYSCDLDAQDHNTPFRFKINQLNKILRTCFQTEDVSLRRFCLVYTLIQDVFSLLFILCVKGTWNIPIHTTESVDPNTPDDTSQTFPNGMELKLRFLQIPFYPSKKHKEELAHHMLTMSTWLLYITQHCLTLRIFSVFKTPDAILDAETHHVALQCFSSIMQEASSSDAINTMWDVNPTDETPSFLFILWIGMCNNACHAVIPKAPLVPRPLSFLDAVVVPLIRLLLQCSIFTQARRKVYVSLLLHTWLGLLTISKSCPYKETETHALLLSCFTHCTMGINSLLRSKQHLKGTSSSEVVKWFTHFVFQPVFPGKDENKLHSVLFHPLQYESVYDTSQFLLWLSGAVECIVALPKRPYHTSVSNCMFEIAMRLFPYGEGKLKDDTPNVITKYTTYAYILCSSLDDLTHLIHNHYIIPLKGCEHGTLSTLFSKSTSTSADILFSHITDLLKRIDLTRENIIKEGHWTSTRHLHMLSFPLKHLRRRVQQLSYSCYQCCSLARNTLHGSEWEALSVSSASYDTHALMLETLQAFTQPLSDNVPFWLLSLVGSVDLTTASLPPVTAHHCVIECTLTQTFYTLLRLLGNLTRCALTCGSQWSVLPSYEDIITPREDYTNVYPFHVEEDSLSQDQNSSAHRLKLLNFVTIVISSYVQSFCYVQLIATALMKCAARVAYRECVHFLRDMIHICSKVILPSTLYVFVNCFSDISHIFAFFAKKLKAPWSIVDTALFDCCSVTAQHAVVAVQVSQLKSPQQKNDCVGLDLDLHHADFFNIVFSLLHPKHEAPQHLPSRRSQVCNTQITPPRTPSRHRQPTSTESELGDDVSVTPRLRVLNENKDNSDCVDTLGASNRTLYLFCRRASNFVCTLRTYVNMLSTQHIGDRHLPHIAFILFMKTAFTVLEPLSTFPQCKLLFYHILVLLNYPTGSLNSTHLFLSSSNHQFSEEPVGTQIFPDALLNDTLGTKTPINRLVTHISRDDDIIYTKLAVHYVIITRYIINMMLVTDLSEFVSHSPLFFEFTKQWILVRPGNPPLPSLDQMAITIIFLKSLYCEFPSATRKIKASYIFFQALYCLSGIREDITFYSRYLLEKYTFLPLANIICSQNRLDLITSWKLRTSTHHHITCSLWSTENAKRQVCEFAEEVLMLSTHRHPKTSEHLRCVELSALVQAVHALTIQWNAQSDRAVVMHTLPQEYHKSMPSTEQCLRFLSAIDPGFAQWNDEKYTSMLHSVLVDTPNGSSQLLALQSALAGCQSIHILMTRLAQNVHSLLLNEFLLKWFPSVVSSSSCQLFSLHFWTNAVLQQQHLPASFYALWLKLARTFLIGRQLFDLLYPCHASVQPLSWNNGEQEQEENLNPIAPWIFPLFTVALTSPIWTHLLTQVANNVSHSVLHHLKSKKEMLCLELSSYLLRLSIVLARYAVRIPIGDGPQATLSQAAEWEEASQYLYDLATTQSSGEAMDINVDAFSSTTPRRHAPTKVIDTTPDVRETVPKGTSVLRRLYAQVTIHRLEALRLLNRHSAFHDLCATILRSISLENEPNHSVAALSLSTVDVIRMGLTLGRYYMERDPVSRHLALLCVTEAFSECSFLINVNENGPSWSDPTFPQSQDKVNMSYQHPSASPSRKPVYNEEHANRTEQAFFPIDVSPPVQPLWCVQTPRQISATLPTVEHCTTLECSTFGETLALQHISESRLLLTVAELTFDAATTLSCLWVATGSLRRAYLVLISSLASTSQRVLVPWRLFTLSCHVLYYQLQRVRTKPLNAIPHSPVTTSCYPESVVLMLTPVLSLLWHHVNASEPQSNSPQTQRYSLRRSTRSKCDVKTHPVRTPDVPPITACLFLLAPTLLSCYITPHQLQYISEELGRFSANVTQILPNLDSQVLSVTNIQCSKLPHLHSFCLMFVQNCIEMLKTANAILQAVPPPDETFVSPEYSFHRHISKYTLKKLNSSVERLFQHVLSLSVLSIHNSCSMNVYDDLKEYVLTSMRLMDTILRLAPSQKKIKDNAYHLWTFSVCCASVALGLATACLVIFQYTGNVRSCKDSAKTALDALVLTCILLPHHKEFQKLLVMQIPLTHTLLRYIARHCRAYWMYRFRQVQKTSLQSSSSSPSKTSSVNTAEFLLQHHLLAQNASPNALVFSPEPPRPLCFPFQWSIIIQHIQQKPKQRRLRFWRWFPEPIVTIVSRDCPIYLKKTLPPSADRKLGCWLSVASRWVCDDDWTSIKEALNTIQNDNYCSAYNSHPITEKDPLYDRPPSHRTRRKLKEIVVDDAKRWWDRRFQVETDLIEWINRWEKVFALHTVLFFLSGWPTFSLKTSFMDALSATTRLCKAWCDMHDELLKLTFTGFLQLTHFTLTVAHNKVEAKLPQNDNGRINLTDALYKEYLEVVLYNSGNRDVSQVMSRLWKSFLNEPIKLLTTYISSVLLDTPPNSAAKKNSSTSSSNALLNSKQHFPLRFPTLLFLDSHDLLSHRIPWDALSPLRYDNITLGVDLYVSEAIYVHWKGCNYPGLNPIKANKFFVLNPSGDSPGAVKSLPPEWFSQDAHPNQPPLLYKEHFINTTPTAEAMIYRLCHDYLYIYCGHGGGAQFLSSDVIQTGYVSLNDARLGIRGTHIKATALLMGCSSIQFETETNGEDYEVHSLALDFLVSGAPSVMGLLWDVTDLELDRFTLNCLLAWCQSWQHYTQQKLPLSHEFWWGTLSHAKRNGRMACYLKWITGAACIQIGLPL